MEKNRTAGALLESFSASEEFAEMERAVESLTKKIRQKLPLIDTLTQEIVKHLPEGQDDIPRISFLTLTDAVYRASAVGLLSAASAALPVGARRSHSALGMVAKAIWQEMEAQNHPVAMRITSQMDQFLGKVRAASEEKFPDFPDWDDEPQGFSKKAKKERVH